MSRQVNAWNARVAAEAAENKIRKTAVRRLVAAFRYGNITPDLARGVLDRAEKVGVSLFQLPDAILLEYLLATDKLVLPVQPAVRSPLL